MRLYDIDWASTFLSSEQVFYDRTRIILQDYKRQIKLRAVHILCQAGEGGGGGSKPKDDESWRGG